MRSPTQVTRFMAIALLLLGVCCAEAQDWPQWRGPNRDGKTTGFQAPATWPASLTKKWDVTVGDGVANPSVVGDRVYVFSRDGGDETLRCLNAASGDEIWKKSYPAAQISGADAGHPGPRATPTVAEGKVVALGVDGMLTCWNAADGAQAWQKDEFVGKSPRFHTASSPIVVDGMCIAMMGGGSGGAMVAYDLNSGAEKWRVAAGSGSYGSPVLMTVGGMKVIIGPTESNMVGISTDGKLVWELPYRQGRYNAATPIVNGDILIIAGPENGISVLKMSKDGDKLKEEQISTAKYVETSVLYNTPVVKDGVLFGLSTSDQLFCVVNITGAEPKTGWVQSIGRPAAVGRLPVSIQNVFAQRQGGGRQGGGRGRRGGGMGSTAGYGSVVDAGSVLLALSPAADLVVFKPNSESYAEVARYKVSEDGDTYAYPVPSGNRIFIKDKDSIALWTVP